MMRELVVLGLTALGLFIYAVVTGIQYSNRTIVVEPSGLSQQGSVLIFNSSVAFPNTSLLNVYNDWILPAPQLQWPLFSSLVDLTQACAASDARCRMVDPIIVGPWRGERVVIVAQYDNRLPPLQTSSITCLTLPVARPGNLLHLGPDGSLLRNDTGRGVRADFCQWFWKNNHSMPVYDSAWWGSTRCASQMNDTTVLGFICSVDETQALLYNDYCPTMADVPQWLDCTVRTFCGITTTTQMQLAIAVPASAPARPVLGFKPYAYYFNVTWLQPFNSSFELLFTWRTQTPLDIFATVALVATWSNGNTAWDILCYPVVATLDYFWTNTAVMAFSIPAAANITTWLFRSDNVYADDPWVWVSASATPCCNSSCQYQNISSGIQAGCPGATPPLPDGASDSGCQSLFTDPLNWVVSDAANDITNYTWSTLLVVTGNVTGPQLDAPQGLILKLAYTATGPFNVMIVALDGFPLVPPVPLPASPAAFTIALDAIYYTKWFPATKPRPDGNTLFSLELLIVRTVHQATLIVFSGVLAKTSALMDWACPPEGELYLQNTAVPFPAMQGLVGHPTVLFDQLTAQQYEVLTDTWNMMPWLVHTAVAAPVTAALDSLEFTLPVARTLCSVHYLSTGSNRVLYTTNPEDLSTAVMFDTTMVVPRASYTEAWMIQFRTPVAECITTSGPMRVRYCSTTGPLFPCTKVPTPPALLCPSFTPVAILTPTQLWSPLPIPNLAYQGTPITENFAQTLASALPPNSAYGIQSLTGIEFVIWYTVDMLPDNHWIVPTTGVLHNPASQEQVGFSWTRRSTSTGTPSGYINQWNGYATYSLPFSISWNSDTPLSDWYFDFDMQAIEILPSWGLSWVFFEEISSLMRIVSDECPPYGLQGDRQSLTQQWTADYVSFITPPVNGPYPRTQTIAPVPLVVDYIQSVTGLTRASTPVLLTTPFYHTAVGMEVMSLQVWADFDDEDASSLPGQIAEYSWSPTGLFSVAWTISIAQQTFYPDTYNNNILSGVVRPDMMDQLSLCRKIPYPMLTPSKFLFDAPLIAYFSAISLEIPGGTIYIDYVGGASNAAQVQFLYRWLYPADVAQGLILAPPANWGTMTPCEG